MVVAEPPVVDPTVVEWSVALLPNPQVPVPQKTETAAPAPVAPIDTDPVDKGTTLIVGLMALPSASVPLDCSVVLPAVADAPVPIVTLVVPAALRLPRLIVWVTAPPVLPIWMVPARAPLPIVTLLPEVSTFNSVAVLGTKVTSAVPYS